MKTETLTSAFKVIGRVQRVFKPNSQDWIADGISAIGEGLEIMKVSKSYVYSETNVDIIEYRGKRPCCIYEIEQIKYNGIRLPIITATNSVKPENITESIVAGAAWCTVEDDVIKTSFESGTITVYAKGIPVDKNGVPKVIDKAEIIIALSWYVLFILLSGGMKHPVYSVDDAFAMWEKTYPQAQNSLILNTIEDMQNFAELWTSILPDTNLVNNMFNQYVESYAVE